MNADLLRKLVEAHFVGDENQFRSILLDIIQDEKRRNQSVFAKELEKFLKNSSADARLITIPIPINFSSHLAHLITRIPNRLDVLTATIASTLYLDNFPPGAHGKLYANLQL